VRTDDFFFDVRKKQRRARKTDKTGRQTGCCCRRRCHRRVFPLAFFRYYEYERRTATIRLLRVVVVCRVSYLCNSLFFDSLRARARAYLFIPLLTALLKAALLSSSRLCDIGTLHTVSFQTTPRGRPSNESLSLHPRGGERIVDRLSPVCQANVQRSLVRRLRSARDGAQRRRPDTLFHGLRHVRRGSSARSVRAQAVSVC